MKPHASGKTTLARRFANSGIMPFNEALNFFDLEDPAHLKRLSSPKRALKSPCVASSQQTVLEHLKLDSLTFISFGEANYPLDKKIKSPV